MNHTAIAHRSRRTAIHTIALASALPDGSHGSGASGFSRKAVAVTNPDRLHCARFHRAGSAQDMKKHLLSLAVVLTAASLASRAQMPVQDDGVAGVWQKLGKLRTTASVMHTTAHPDDEHGESSGHLGSRMMGVAPDRRDARRPLQDDREKVPFFEYDSRSIPPESPGEQSPRP